MHAAATLALPYFHLGSLDIGLPIQSFGVIVAAGVLIGASLLRRYAEWHGVSDEQIRHLTAGNMVPADPRECAPIQWLAHPVPLTIGLDATAVAEARDLSRFTRGRPAGAVRVVGRDPAVLPAWPVWITDTSGERTFAPERPQDALSRPSTPMDVRNLSQERSAA